MDHATGEDQASGHQNGPNWPDHRGNHGNVTNQIKDIKIHPQRGEGSSKGSTVDGLSLATNVRAESRAISAVKRASAIAGIHRQTIYRLLKNSVFRPVKRVPDARRARNRRTEAYL